MWKERACKGYEHSTGTRPPLPPCTKLLSIICQGFCRGLVCACSAVSIIGLSVLPSTEHCCPSVIPVLFSEGSRLGFNHSNLCSFLAHFSVTDWKPVLEPFSPKQSTSSGENLERFQAPSLPVFKAGLFWVSESKAKVAIIHSHSPQIKWAHDYTSQTCVILKGSVMGNKWHDSKWERRKPSMHGSIPQVGGHHCMNHQRVQHFLAACVIVRPFAVQALVSQHAFTHLQQGSAGYIHFLKLKLLRLSLWRSRWQGNAVLYLTKLLNNINSRGKNSRDDLV